MAGMIVDGHNVETHRAIANAALAQKIMRSADQDVMLFLRDAELGQRGLPFHGGTGAHFDEDERVAVVADQVYFAFTARGRVIARDKEVAEAPQVPVSIRFPAHARLQRLLLLRIGGGVDAITQAMARLPAYQCKPDSRHEAHGTITDSTA